MPRSRRELGQSFARRIYGPRSLGCALSTLFVGAVQFADPVAPGWIWMLMVLNAFVWPTVAYLVARAAPDPFVVEQRNLALDGLFAGLWVGQMSLNLLPSALLLSMVSMNAVAAGGWRRLRISLVLQAAGLLAVLALRDFDIMLQTSYLQMVACIPMLIIYPLIVGRASHGLAVQLAEHKKAFKLISSLDGMTRLLHHAAWMQRLSEIYLRCRKGEVVAILALLDIDDFKRINDTHGHLVGDAFIARLASLLRGGLGAQAIPGRYGGDEFCVLLFDVSVSQAYAQLNDIRKRFAEWADGTAPAQASLSIGMVPYSRKYASERDWLQATDEALYRAKQNGKNRLWLQELPTSRENA
jgi:diguanylate cyclase